jgi:hypothetical protein
MTYKFRDNAPFNPVGKIRARKGRCRIKKVS